MKIYYVKQGKRGITATSKRVAQQYARAAHNKWGRKPKVYQIDLVRKLSKSARKYL